jgi:hypothetical protein
MKIKKASEIFGDCNINLLPTQYKIKIKKGCDRIGTKIGEEYVAEKYKFDPYGKLYLPKIDCFEYVGNIEFVTLEDRASFYK